MIAYNAYNQYKENSIFTASPEEHPDALQWPCEVHHARYGQY